MPDNSMMCLGKLAPKFNRKTLPMAKYLRGLPPIPQSFSHANPAFSYPMMKNDTVGDCTIASPGHLIQTWTRLNGNEIIVSDSEIITTYSAVTGLEGAAYDPATGENDNGCAITDVLNYWQTQGIGGHKIDGWVGIDVSKRDQVLAAIYLFGGVDIGVQLPVNAQNQSEWALVGDGQTGDSAPGSWGGHSVPLLGFSPAYLSLITWGMLMHMDPNFWLYVDEAYIPLSQDWAGMTIGSPDHFDYASLTVDLQALKA